MARPEETMTEVDFVFLADHAEVVNGKLYLIGGGWNRVARVVPVALPGQPEPPPPPPVRFAIVASVIVDWNETSEKIPLSIGIETLDGTRLMHVEGMLEA